MNSDNQSFKSSLNEDEIFLSDKQIETVDGANSIHNFDFELIGEYFSNIGRQGPGGYDQTIKALNFVDGLSAHSKIADLGCGTGAQTMILAQYTSAHIVALDLFPLFIEKLRSRVESIGIGNRIETIVGSMDDLPFTDNEFDLIWSEGAIYNIGYQRGLKEWRKYLKDGGYLVVSEASWFTDKRPAEIELFWNDAYSEMDTISRKVNQMESAGYIPMAVFALPEYCWMDNYYIPQIKAQGVFLQKYAGNATAMDLVNEMRRETELYTRYKQYYGYVFYIGKKL